MESRSTITSTPTTATCDESSDVPVRPVLWTGGAVDSPHRAIELRWLPIDSTMFGSSSTASTILAALRALAPICLAPRASRADIDRLRRCNESCRPEVERSPLPHHEVTACTVARRPFGSPRHGGSGGCLLATSSVSERACLLVARCRPGLGLVDPLTQVNRFMKACGFSNDARRTSSFSSPSPSPSPSPAAAQDGPVTTCLGGRASRPRFPTVGILLVRHACASMSTPLDGARSWRSFQ